MLAETVLVLVEPVQTAIEPGAVDGLEGHAGQILQGAVRHTSVRPPPACFGCAEAGDGQDAGDQLPRHGLAAWFDDLAHEGVQPEPPPQCQSEKDLAEVAHAFDAKGANIHLGPPGGWRSGRHRFAQLAPHDSRAAPVEQIGDVLPTVARVLVEAWCLATRLATNSCRGPLAVRMVRMSDQYA